MTERDRIINSMSDAELVLWWSLFGERPTSPRLRLRVAALVDAGFSAERASAAAARSRAEMAAAVRNAALPRADRPRKAKPVRVEIPPEIRLAVKRERNRAKCRACYARHAEQRRARRRARYAKAKGQVPVRQVRRAA